MAAAAEQLLCPAGRFCPATGGLLPPGASGAASIVLPCPPLAFCPEGSGAPVMCASPVEVCPAGSAAPLQLGLCLLAALLLLLLGAVHVADARRLRAAVACDVLEAHHAGLLRPRLRAWLARARGTRGAAAAGAPTHPPPPPVGLSTFKPIPPHLRVNLEVRGLGLTVPAGPGRRAALLTDVTATFPAGTLTYIVGTSGCGKTTLLNALLGALPSARGARRSGGPGAVTANGDPLDWDAGGRNLVAHVPAGDLLPVGVAAHDALGLAAELRCDAALPRAVRERRVEEVEVALGLGGRGGGGVRHLRLGGPATAGGLSSGQRKRLGIAAEVLGGPASFPSPIMLLDEPTSAVDAATALALMGFVRGYAHGLGATVVCVIHQPRLETWALVRGRGASRR